MSHFCATIRGAGQPKTTTGTNDTLTILTDLLIKYADKANGRTICV